MSILRSVVGIGGARDSAASVSRRDAWARRLPLLPAFIYVFLVTQIAFVLTIYYSFFSWNLLKPGSFRFSGLDNYLLLVTDESVRIAIWNTVLLTVSVIAISVILGMAVALLLNSEIFGKGILRTLMIAPFLGAFAGCQPCFGRQGCGSRRGDGRIAQFCRHYSGREKGATRGQSMASKRIGAQKRAIRLAEARYANPRGP